MDKKGRRLLFSFFNTFYKSSSGKDFKSSSINERHRLPVRLEERDFTEKIATVEDYQELDICIASSRLDVFLAGVFKLSRNQANQLIEKQAVQVNYHLVEKSDYTVQVGDLISVRKFGRLKLIRDNGQTKKDKKKLTVQLLLSK